MARVSSSVKAELILFVQETVCLLTAGNSIVLLYLFTLAVIGTGWSGRKKYFEEIGRMPIWMQPTGSFGIGIQSGFMMTNRIRIITRGMRDWNINMK